MDAHNAENIGERGIEERHERTMFLGGNSQRNQHDQYLHNRLEVSPNLAQSGPVTLVSSFQSDQVVERAYTAFSQEPQPVWNTLRMHLDSHNSNLDLFRNAEEQLNISEETLERAYNHNALTSPNTETNLNYQHTVPNTLLTASEISVTMSQDPISLPMTSSPIDPSQTSHSTIPSRLQSNEITQALVTVESNSADLPSLPRPFNNNAILDTITGVNNDENYLSDNIQITIGPNNFDLYSTLRDWSKEILYIDLNHPVKKRRPIIRAVEYLRNSFPEPVELRDLCGEKCDIQGINWNALGVSRRETRERRRNLYRNFSNFNNSRSSHTHLNGYQIKNRESYFKFRRMDFNHEIQIIHFQLRNLIACPTRDHIYYASQSKILHYSPIHGKKSSIPSTVLDLSEPERPSSYSMTEGIQITTIAAGHGILIAGGFCGEYGLLNLRAEKGTKHTQGLITKHPNSTTNNIQIHMMRSNASPVAAFASNHTSLRLLNVYTNTVISEQVFNHAINCSAISPDKRLRVIVGDTNQVLICESETGKLIYSLDGHSDYGFSCDWADDGWTVATGCQGQQIKIWDARKWTTINGDPYQVTTIKTEMAGARKLKFSPIGSGKRVLVAAEPADYLSIIDAETFASKQTISFFGEISGFDFANNGQDLFVANSDSIRGGIMEFERTNFAGEGRYYLESALKQKRKTRKDVGSCDWMSEDKLVRHPNSQATLVSIERRAASLGVEMSYF